MNYVELNLAHLLGFKIDLPMPKIGAKNGIEDELEEEETEEADES